MTAAVLTAVDRARADAGCGALRQDETLAAAALTNSTQMAAQGAAGVVAPAGSAAAVATGPADADAVVAAWLADKAASTQLLDCTWTTAGAAEVTGDGGPWWTLFLA